MTETTETTTGTTTETTAEVARPVSRVPGPSSIPPFVPEEDDERLADPLFAAGYVVGQRALLAAWAYESNHDPIRHHRTALAWTWLVLRGDLPSPAEPGQAVPPIAATGMLEGTPPAPEQLPEYWRLAWEYACATDDHGLRTALADGDLERVNRVLLPTPDIRMPLSPGTTPVPSVILSDVRPHISYSAYAGIAWVTLTPARERMNQVAAIPGAIDPLEPPHLYERLVMLTNADAQTHANTYEHVIGTLEDHADTGDDRHARLDAWKQRDPLDPPAAVLRQLDTVFEQHGTEMDRLSRQWSARH